MQHTTKLRDPISYFGVGLVLIALCGSLLLRYVSVDTEPNASQVQRAIGTVDGIIATGSSSLATPAGSGLTYQCAPHLVSLNIMVNDDYFLPNYGSMSIRSIERLATLKVRDSQESVSLELYGPIKPIKSLIIHAASTGAFTPDEQLTTVSQANLDSGTLTLRTADFTTGYIDEITACIEPDIV